MEAIGYIVVAAPALIVWATAAKLNGSLLPRKDQTNA